MSDINAHLTPLNSSILNLLEFLFCLSPSRRVSNQVVSVTRRKSKVLHNTSFENVQAFVVSQLS